MIESIYNAERNLSNLDTKAFSSIYFDIVTRINRGSVCDGVEQYSMDFGMPLSPKTLTNSECLNISDGILQKGLQTVIISRL